MSTTNNTNQIFTAPTSENERWENRRSSISAQGKLKDKARRQSRVVSNIEEEKEDKRAEESIVAIRSVSASQDSVIDGLLLKFYQPGFLANFEAQDKENRMKILKHILTQFEKIDKLLMASNCTSLDIDFEKAIMKILSDTEEMMQTEKIVLYEIDPNSEELVLKEFDNDEDTLLKSRKVFPRGSGIAGFAAATKDLINVSDPRNFTHYHSTIDTGGFNVQPEQIIACPLMMKNGPVIGVLELVNKVGENGKIIPFDEEDEYLLKLLARTLTIVLTNARSIAKITDTRKKVEVLLETTKSLTSILDFDELIKKIMESAKELLDADRCTLFLKDATRKQLVAKILVHESIQEIRIKMDAGIAGSVLMSGGIF